MPKIIDREISSNSDDPIFVRSTLQLYIDEIIRDLRTSSIEIIYSITTKKRVIFDIFIIILRKKFADEIIHHLDSLTKEEMLALQFTVLLGDRTLKHLLNIKYRYE